MTIHRQRGFTLAEVIITVAIIALVSTIALVSYSKVRATARDSARVSSVNQIMTALQLYRNDNKSYPEALIPGQPLTANSVTYMGSIPTSPTPRADGDCEDKDYRYEKTAKGYQITFCLGKDTGTFKKGITVCENGQCQAGGQLKVADVDGNEYDTVVIGKQLWLAENYRAKIKPDGTCINGGGQPPCADASGADNGLGRSCMDNNEAHCSNYGALYTWDAAMDGSTTEGAQGICPAGWHVPTTIEHNRLDKFLNDPSNANCDDTPAYGNGCPPAGLRLRLGQSSGFNSVWSGYRDTDGSSFDGFHVVQEEPFDMGGGAAHYWSSTSDGSNAWEHTWAGSTTVDSEDAYRIESDKGFAYSLRCIKNY